VELKGLQEYLYRVGFGECTQCPAHMRSELVPGLEIMGPHMNLSGLLSELNRKWLCGRDYWERTQVLK